MDAKMWIILILIGFILLNYTDKIDGDSWLDKGKDQAVSLKDKFFGGECSNVYDPVCAGGTTYNNQCEASKAGKDSVTMGTC